MIKKVISLVAILFVLVSNQVFAHTALKDSTPKEGDIVSEPLQEITLSFETKIEQTSTFEVLNTNGESVDLEKLTIEEDIMKGSFSQPLENGDYKVIWKIVGADGHIIEGEYSFSMDTPVEETPQELETEEDTSQVDNNQEEQNEEDAAEPIEESVNESAEKDQSLPTFVIPTIVGVLALIGVGFLWWLLRRKK